MSRDDPAARPLRQRTMLPTGPAVLALVHDNVATNLRKDQAPDVVLPSLWRLAAHVVRERSPLRVYERARGGA